MLICSFAVGASAAELSPALLSERTRLASVNPVSAVYTDEEGNTVEVDADYTLTEIAPLSEDGETVYKLTAYASSPKKGSNDDGVCWATMSVYYTKDTKLTYTMHRAAGDWSFGNYPGASLSSASVKFVHQTTSDTVKVSKMYFDVQNPRPISVSHNNCTSTISYRTSASRPLSTLKLTVAVPD